MTYEEAIAFINSFGKSGAPIKDLGRFSAVMDRLQNPQDGMKFIHIAGTNGKGSVTRYCAESLSAAEVRTGEFTSPYIIDFTDRIRIDGRNIAREDVARLSEKISPAVSPDCSAFELTAAMAFCRFAEEGCGVVCLETGIGGRLDATNIIKSPLVSVITAIGLDHVGILGNSIESIAREKAGIIKRGRPAVIYPELPPEAESVIRRRAGELSSPVISPDLSKLDIISEGIFGSEFIYKGERYKIRMAGRHQVMNAVTAIEALSLIGVEPQFIRRGLFAAAVPARCELFRESPPVILDGAHNPNGMAALRDVVAGLGGAVVCIGMLHGKNELSALREIAPFIKSAVAVGDFYPGAVGATETAELLRGCGVAAVTAADEREAVTLTLDIAEREAAAAVFAGSLYLAARLRPILSERFSGEVEGMP